MLSLLPLDRAGKVPAARLKPAQKVNFPSALTAVVAYISAIGGKCYLTGGAVRDLLLQRPCHDFDLSVDLPPQAIQRIPGAQEMSNVTKTIIIKNRDIEIEITPLENKGKTRMVDDLVDRDLTINSAALPLFYRHGQLILGTLLDPSGMGVKDINDGLIRFLGEVTPERVIRACRFIATLDFSAPPETIEVLRKQSNNVTAAPVEIIHNELIKILKADNPRLAFSIMKETGIFQQLLKYAGISESLPQTANIERVARADKSVRLIVLLRELGYNSKTVKDFLKKYAFSNDETSKTQKLLEALEMTEKRFPEIQQSDRAIREILCRLVGNKQKDQYLSDYIKLIKAYRSISELMEINIQKATNSPLTVKELKVNGEDAMEAGFSGRQVGQALNHLLQLVIADPSLNERENLLGELKTYLKTEIS